MEKLQAFLNHLKETGNMKAMESAESFREAAAAFGISPEEAKQMIDQIDGFPLDDDELSEISGGIGGFIFNHPKRTELE